MVHSNLDDAGIYAILRREILCSFTAVKDGDLIGIVDATDKTAC